MPVAGYIMNECVMRKGELEELDKMVKDLLRERKIHGRQASDEWLYMTQEEGRRGLMSFKDVYVHAKARVVCYMT